jgi:cytochrome c oxidase cbb3-type subunit I/II
MSPGSIMPLYPWMIDDQLDNSSLEAKIRGMQKLGVPYPENYNRQALSDLDAQANLIAQELVDSGIEAAADKEIIALIAYLQRLGTDIKLKEAE